LGSIPKKEGLKNFFFKALHIFKFFSSMDLEINERLITMNHKGYFFFYTFYMSRSPCHHVNVLPRQSCLIAMNVFMWKYHGAYFVFVFVLCLKLFFVLHFTSTFLFHIVLDLFIHLVMSRICLVFYNILFRFVVIVGRCYIIYKLNTFPYFCNLSNLYIDYRGSNINPLLIVFFIPFLFPCL